MAKIPEIKVERRLKDLRVGESCFTIPWAMWVNLEGECFLNEDYPAYTGKSGTVELKVIRIQDGYIAFINDINYKWNKTNSPGFVGCNEKDLYGKVIGFSEKEALNRQLEIAISTENYELAAEIKKTIEKISK